MVVAVAAAVVLVASLLVCFIGCRHMSIIADWMSSISPDQLTWPIKRLNLQLDHCTILADSSKIVGWFLHVSFGLCLDVAKGNFTEMWPET